MVLKQFGKPEEKPQEENTSGKLTPAELEQYEKAGTAVAQPNNPEPHEEAGEEVKAEPLPAIVSANHYVELSHIVGDGQQFRVLAQCKCQWEGRFASMSEAIVASHKHAGK